MGRTTESFLASISLLVLSITAMSKCWLFAISMAFSSLSAKKASMLSGIAVQSDKMALIPGSDMINICLLCFIFLLLRSLKKGLFRLGPQDDPVLQGHKASFGKFEWVWTPFPMQRACNVSFTIVPSCFYVIQCPYGGK